MGCLSENLLTPTYNPPPNVFGIFTNASGADPWPSSISPTFFLFFIFIFIHLPRRSHPKLLTLPRYPSAPEKSAKPHPTPLGPTPLASPPPSPPPTTTNSSWCASSPLPLDMKAASSIYGRFISLCGGETNVVPEAVLALTPQQLRQIGVSTRNAGYLHDLASMYCGGILYDAAIISMDDKSLFSMLTMVKGIHMLMIFSLHRPDVLSIFRVSWRPL